MSSPLGSALNASISDLKDLGQNLGLRALGRLGVLNYYDYDKDKINLKSEI